MSKVNFTVVRNEAYTANSIGVRERHNERKNETYYNSDIIPERANLNVHFQQNFSPAGTPETYEQTFNRLLESGAVYKRGLKPDAKVFDELVFDVNTEYFERNGGFEFAKKFYEEAYKLAVKEVGEQYILSAVLHADERNSALSEQLGRDVFHYHLHVVYVPVVEKEILWTKRCSDPTLVGKVKEVIPQISHSKKWPRIKTEKGFINSYSLLQDRYFEHMKEVGFDGFERGERGSTTEHLEVLEFKTKKESERFELLEKQIESERKKADNLVEVTKVRADIAATQSEIEHMAKSGKSGKNKIVANEDWEIISTMAKRCALLDEKMKSLQEQVKQLQRDRDKWKSNYERLWNEVKDFIKAIRSAPQKILAFIRENFKQKSYNREEIL
jgi:hypothetical protein